ncbi:4-alpha-glucanotransferase [Aeromicrobium ginsengisoli]|uniref:4-alpha-glucanotransferase n=1 Tax=Aeromicrobium ginsengisoli TaxID=363867 RepID=A0A5M4FEY3_9ACTN|nr:4-alpha-glucanotransferase [Aeromicrobium ginsengisoli]KAA1397915.1 4-alpha-glucanotransferase [Aeromicrobium ginsengisoli]
MAATDDTDALNRLAAAHGVAMAYEGSDRELVTVDAEIVIAVLARLDVDASSPESIERELALVEAELARRPLPATIAVTQGTGRAVGVAGRLLLEDGSELAVDGELPADLPLGWHRFVTGDQEITVVVAPARMPEVPRTWGWMLQLYALRSATSWGMGDYGDLAETARRAGVEQGAGVLLVNPVQAFMPSHPLERSPYSPASRRFANPLYLRVTDTAAFAAADDRAREDVLALMPDQHTELIDYDAVWAAKLAALELLWVHAGTVDRDDPDLDAYATFAALAELHGADWREWPEELRDPAGDAVAGARTSLASRIDFHAWLQVLCRDQLDAARAAAHDAGMAVGIVHDLPVGVHPGGADAWALQDTFASDVRVGCPADAFNPLGQDWGLPPWRPDKLAESGYAPFRDVIRSVLRHGDGIRIDHIAGLWRLWWIPPGEPAHRGTYVHYDSDVMLAVLTLEAHRAGAIVVGEDLGTVEEVVTETMHARGILSSAVLWFERDWDAPGQPHVPPQDWEPETMASISTHDLPTVTGWLQDERIRVQADLGLLDGPADQAYAQAAADREALFDLLTAEGIPTDDPVVALHAVIARAASRLVLSSPADAVGQVQQPNLPGTVDEYPNWRIPLPVDLDAFFADERVHASVAPLRAARPAS